MDLHQLKHNNLFRIICFNVDMAAILVDFLYYRVFILELAKSKNIYG